jgi:hypothetical protein
LNNIINIDGTINIVTVLPNNSYQYSLSLPVRKMVQDTVGGVIARVHQERLQEERGGGGKPRPVCHYRNMPSRPRAKILKFDLNCCDIDVPRNHTDSQARSSNRPTVGGNGRNRNNAHLIAGNDTNRPADVTDIRVSHRSGMAEPCP